MRERWLQKIIKSCGMCQLQLVRWLLKLPRLFRRRPLNLRRFYQGITTQLEKHGLVVDEESEGIKARYRNGARRTAGKLV